jgi:sulfite exporter TauE/SafE
MGCETAFLLGLVGGLHCLGMCGPLAIAQPAPSKGIVRRVCGRLTYNGGRIVTYALMGVVFGAFGGILELKLLQRGLSVVVGVGLVLCLVFTFLGPGWLNPSRGAYTGVGYLQRKMAGLLKRRSLPGAFLLGLLNGLLPCGLVYVALAGAIAAGSVAGGALYMTVFGVGTLPAMLAVGLLGLRVQGLVALRPRYLVPAAGLAVAALLVLRGMSLGIPYLSPSFSAEEGAEPSCCEKAANRVEPRADNPTRDAGSGMRDE